MYLTDLRSHMVSTIGGNLSSIHLQCLLWSPYWVLPKGFKDIAGSDSTDKTLKKKKKNAALFLFYQHRCKAWSNCGPITPTGREKGRLAGPGPPPGCSATALVSTWLCPLSASQRPRWMGVNWNQFPLSDTINGVACGKVWRGGGGGRGPLVTDPAAQACLEFATWNWPLWQ